MVALGPADRWYGTVILSTHPTIQLGYLIPYYPSCSLIILLVELLHYSRYCGYILWFLSHHHSFEIIVLKIFLWNLGYLTDSLSVSLREVKLRGSSLIHLYCQFRD